MAEGLTIEGAEGDRVLGVKLVITVDFDHESRAELYSLITADLDRDVDGFWVGKGSCWVLIPPSPPW